MATTLIGYFESDEDAKRTQEDLLAAGFGRDEVDLVRQPGATQEKGFWEQFKDMFSFTDEADRAYYEEATRRGGALVRVHTSDEREQIAADIIDRHNPADLDRKAEEWRASGWTGYRAVEQAGQTQQAGRTEQAEGEEHIPVVEEELQVGKRAVRRGGVRIHKHVVERPVSEEVSLRDEEIHVERRRVDRPVSAADEQAFKDRTIEVTETDEEAVVSKQARVTEEVVVNKDIRERREEVRDTVRKTDVDVERLEGSERTGTSTHGRDYDRMFREDFETTYAGGGQAYDQYRPAYEYGRDLALDQRYRNHDWNQVEPEARAAFEQRNPGRWNEYSGAIRSGFERTRGRA